MKKKKVRRKLGKRLTPEQRAEAVALVKRGDLTIKQVAASVGCSTRSLERWGAALERSDEATPLTAAERRRLRQLERENKELKLQLEIQKKLQAFSRGRTP